MEKRLRFIHRLKLFSDNLYWMEISEKHSVIMLLWSCLLTYIKKEFLDPLFMLMVSRVSHSNVSKLNTLVPCFKESFLLFKIIANIRLEAPPNFIARGVELRLLPWNSYLVAMVLTEHEKLRRNSNDLNSAGRQLCFLMKKGSSIHGAIVLNFLIWSICLQTSRCNYVI